MTAAIVGSIAVAVSILLAQALRRRPLDRLHPLALTVLGLCVLALAGSYLVVVRAVLISRRSPKPTRSNRAHPVRPVRGTGAPSASRSATGGSPPRCA